MGFRDKIKKVIQGSEQGSSSRSASVTVHQAGRSQSSGEPEIKPSAPPKPLGIETLSSGKSPIADIVFVHGLTGHRDQTWTGPDATEPWPKSLLATEIPNARILTYGYDADVVHWIEAAGQNTTREHAQNLVNDLCNDRTRTKSTGRPILFVVHSLGGLVVQDALLLCVNPSDESQATILSSTRGVCFLGTPNAGSDFTKFATAVANVITLSFVKTPNAQLLEVLKARSEVLANIKNGFLTLVRRRVEEGSIPVRLHAFVEELPVTATGHRVVTPESAVIPGYNSSTIPENHINMTKFSKKDDVGYQRVSGKLMDWVMEIDEASGLLGPFMLRQRTNQILPHQDAMNDLKLGDKSYYRYPKYHSKVVDRPDVGAQLTNSLKHQGLDSTRIAVLYGMGGQGKTMLAVNYCRQAEKKHLFLAIFWLDASSEDTLQKGLVTISDVVKRSEDQLFESPDARVRFALQRIEEWNRPWLLIMDNYDDPGRLPNLISYIPNSTHGSVLVTSRQANLERLGSVIEVPPMSKAEALLLLYDRSGSANRFAGEDEHAAKIVELLGYLPLAIDQAGAYIQRRVDLSLSRFVEEYGDRKISIWSKAPRIWDYKAPVYTTWEMSFELIDEDKDNRDEKGRVLTMLSFLDFRSISQEIFKVPRSSISRGADNAVGTPKWLHLLLKADGEWDLLKLEEVLTDFKDLSLLQLSASRPGALQLSLHPLVSEWMKYRADLETRRQCLYEAIFIVKICLEAKLHSTNKFFLSVEAEQQVFRHQFSCMVNLRELQKEDSNFMKRSPFSEPSVSSEEIIRTTQPIDQTTRVLEQDITESSIQVQSLLNDQNLQQKQAIMNWLSRDNSDSKQADLISRAVEGTGEWFVNETNFQDWLSRDYQTLWVIGPPACGKTIITSQVIHYLTRTRQDAVCLFFFCDYGGSGDHLRILCALLKQAVNQLGSIPLDIRNSYRQHTKLQTQPNSAEVNHFLFAVISALAKRVYIVIDALDELERGVCRRLSKAVMQLAGSFPSFVNVMVTSRPTFLGTDLWDLRTIEIRAQMSDMILLVNASLASSHLARILNSDPALKEVILKSIVDASGGMMRLAQMYLDELSKKPTKRAIRKSLQHLPTSLDHAYEQSILRIKDQDSSVSQLAMQILMWLSYTMRPLRSRELQHALVSLELKPEGHNFDEEVMVDLEAIPSMCGGLVIVEEDPDVVRLAHYSAQQYLQHTKDDMHPEPSVEITRGCIRYLSMDPFAAGPCPETEIRDRILEYPFATYAAPYWVQHAKQKQEAFTDEMVSEVAKFLGNEGVFASWIQVLAYVEDREIIDSSEDDDELREPALSQRLAKCTTPLEATDVLGLGNSVRDRTVSEAWEEV